MEIPLYVPTREGLNPEITMGKVVQTAPNRLTLQFDESFPAEAIQRMLARGENLGLTFVMTNTKKEEN